MLIAAPFARFILPTASFAMSSWSLVLWRPPPPHASRVQEPVYSLNPHVAALLRGDHLPRSLPVSVDELATLANYHEENSPTEETPAPANPTSETEPMDIDNDYEPAAEPTSAMAVDEGEPVPGTNGTPPAEAAPLPSEEDDPFLGVRHQGIHKRPAVEIVSCDLPVFS